MQGHLAVYSSFFEKLFYGDFAESKQAEVELKDVMYDDVVTLLRVCVFSNLKPIEKRT